MSRATLAALICPGQGAQRAGGVSDLAGDIGDLSAQGREAFQLASEIVGRDLWQLGLSSDAADEGALRQPSLLQPFLIAWALAELGESAERLERFDFVSGHSSGMNSALVLAGAIELEPALRFAWQCGLSMDRDCSEAPGGLLALVGAGRAIAELIAESSGTQLANHNAVDQTVIGGDEQPLQLAAAVAPSRGVQAVGLRVAGAFHTAAFAASDACNRALIDELPISEPFTPIVGNCSGQIISTAESLRAELRGQYVRPVEWLSVLDTLYTLGVRRYVTLGPGNVMAGLTRRYGRSAAEQIQIQRMSQLRITASPQVQQSDPESVRASDQREDRQQ